MTEKQTADLDMIASGALSPLTGLIGKADYAATVETMHLAGGLPWALPVTLGVEGGVTADRIALEGNEGDLLAVMDVAEVFEADGTAEAEKVYRTTEDAIPGSRGSTPRANLGGRADQGVQAARAGIPGGAA